MELNHPFREILCVIKMWKFYFDLLVLEFRLELCILKDRMSDSHAGFEEVAHTADLEIRVWGKDLEELFKAAVEGMFHLCGVESPEEGSSTFKKTLDLQAMDYEGLLILFLEELLYHLTEDYQLLEVTKLSIGGEFQLKAQLKGTEIESYQRDIKAVTYHNLNIVKAGDGYTVDIVFDI
jgi:SHS2 domain-containing protein